MPCPNKLPTDKTLILSECFSAGCLIVFVIINSFKAQLLIFSIAFPDKTSSYPAPQVSNADCWNSGRWQYFLRLRRQKNQRAFPRPSADGNG